MARLISITIPAILISLAALTGCTTIPEPIEERYLSEKTDSEAKTISGIEHRIISKNKEQQAAEKRLAELPGQGPVEDEIKALKKENDRLNDAVDADKKKKDNGRLASDKALLDVNEKKRAAAEARIKFMAAEKKLAESDLNLRKAELAVYVAQLNYEESRVAETYRKKHEPVKEGNSGNFATRLLNKNDSADPYGYKKYQEFYEKQKKELSETEKEHTEIEKAYNEAKNDLEAKEKAVNTPGGIK